ncbi:MAG TPA: hypothetical protein PLA99_02880, partial [Candidatus Paceibacterota bacterium]|nr:hypothetical protein [Candidatus Paceibacterota bacterium]
MKNKITIFLIIAIIGTEMLPFFVAKAQCDPKDPDCVTSGGWDYGGGTTGANSPSVQDLYKMTPTIQEPDLTDSPSIYQISKGDLIACISLLSSDLGNLIKKVTGLVSGFINKISFGLFGGGGGPQQVGPQQVITVGGTDTKAACQQWLKDKKATIQARKAQIVKILLSIAAKTFMNHLVYSTVDWISGRTTGQPRFVTNWRDFFGEVADEAFGRFIENSPFSELCEPF